MASLKGNIFWNSVRVLSNLLFPLITFPYASRILGPNGIGLFNYVFAISAYFTLFSSFGFSLYGTREVAIHKNANKNLSDLINSILTGNIIIALIVSISYIIFCYLFIASNRTLFLVAGGLIILTPLSFEWFYQGMEDFKYITIRGLFIKSLSLICLFIFVKDSSDLLVYAILNVTATCGNNLLNLTRLRKYIKIRLTLKNIGTHIKGASVFFLGTIAISLYSYMNDIIVGLTDNMEGVGFFSTGNKIIHIVLQLLGVITVSIMPRMSSLVGMGNKQQASNLLKNTLTLVMYVAIPIAVGIFIMAKPIVILFAGDKFLPSVGVIRILCSLIIIISISQFYGNQILIPNRKEKYGNYGVIIGAAVNLGLAIILVPKLSFYGVAISLLCAEIVVTSIMGIFAYRNEKLSYRSYFPVKAVISTIAMAVTIYIINSLSNSIVMTFITILIGIFVYLACLYIMNDRFAKEELFIPILKRFSRKP